MAQDPLQVLQAAARAAPRPGLARGRVLVAGATGALGEAVLRQLAGSGAWEAVLVLAGEPLVPGLRQLQPWQVAGDDPAAWPLPAADAAVVLFEPPRAWNQRERALWTPQPPQLLPLAQWLRAGGVRTLAVVLPHASGRLPEALKRGLAGLDEHAVASLGFERVLFLRSAQRPPAAGGESLLARLAQRMLSIFGYMVPASELPVRPEQVADLLAAALQLAPPGIHVAAPDVVWQAGREPPLEVARRWLQA